MATKKQAGPSKSREVVKWDEQLAKQATVAAAMEANVGGGGQFFSLKSGQLSFNDAPLPNNEMAVIILDHILENVFYEEKYDPDAIQPPTCFAFGRDEKEMSPHEDVVEAEQAQSDLCKDCPMNEWGSADVGRGKACRNTRRLAMIPAGHFDRNGKFEMIDDEDHFKSAQIAYMKLPVTSITGYAAFVKQVAGALRRPPHGIVTRVKVVPDAKTQFKVVFEPLGNVPDELMGIIMERHEDAAKVIEFPYSLTVEEEQTPRRKPGKKAQAPVRKPAAKKAAPVAKKAVAGGKRRY